MTVMAPVGWSWPRKHPRPTIAALLLVGVVAYVVYRLQPHGYRNLERLEKLANSYTVTGGSVVDVSSCFQAGGIEFTTYPRAIQETPFFFNGQRRIVAHRGEIFIVASTRSGASGPFPCGRADLHIVLVFAIDEKLRDRLVERSYTCP